MRDDQKHIGQVAEFFQRQAERERPDIPAIIQQPGKGGGGGGWQPSIFKIISPLEYPPGTGVYPNFVYVCRKQKLADLYLAVNPFSDESTTEYYVFNVAYTAGLVAGDILIGWPGAMFNGDPTYIGFSPKYGWWHE